MTLNQYQREAERTMPMESDRFPLFYSATMTLHALFGLGAEVGELYGLYQKIYQGHELDMEHAKKELGDILWMVAEFATANGWTLEDVAMTNINKLRLRYPNGFEEEKSLNRDPSDI